MNNRKAIGTIFKCLAGLNELSRMNSSGPMPKIEEDSSKIYFELAEAKKGWDVSMFTLWEEKGMSIDIWTDRKRCKQLLIAIRGKGVTGIPPIQFMLLDDTSCTLEGSFSVISPELLSEGRQKALQYMYDPTKPNGIPYEDLFTQKAA